ncbi:ribose-5-phosphate isomerase RpiA [Palleronia caenipelagi]|uniref:Ribose-5-phosphate isomerase A n=1 Tax=Palleronia caenipelagi TaxID=2489174 RepID=A0A547Q7T4_9RHOB|nr:ribose-5-phosphate isomerase RpiA [Palleronia caenipelagi]TRD22455.1 ribose-5-phosphate isomerase RpiA [Palleronia caenipelagi]
MSANLSPIDAAKYAAARKACDYVESGMKIGLGTGSTAAWLVRCLAEMVREDGLKITGVPTSSRTAEMAQAAGIPITTLDEVGRLDLTIDGADEADGNLTLIKGGGGALLQEKIVATASERMIVIADTTKRVETLGAFPLPIEVVRFGWKSTREAVAEILSAADVMDTKITLREADGQPYVTDEGHHILDLHLGRIGAPGRLAQSLLSLPGVVETGLFIDICDVLITGHGDGRVEIRDLDAGTVTEDRVTLGADDNIFRAL